MSQNNIDPYQPPTIGTGAASATSDAETLRNIAVWQRFFSVLGYVVSGLAILAFIIQTLVASASLPPGPAIIGGLITTVFFVGLMVIVYIVPAILLGTAARATRDFGEGRISVSDYAKPQQRFWRYLGIMVCIAMAINIMLLVLLVILGLTFAGVQRPMS